MFGWLGQATTLGVSFFQLTVIGPMSSAVVQRKLLEYLIDKPDIAQLMLES